jgi:hypothetical protein
VVFRQLCSASERRINRSEYASVSREHFCCFEGSCEGGNLHTMYEPIQNTRPDTERLLQSMATHDERGGGPAGLPTRQCGECSVKKNLPEWDVTVMSQVVNSLFASKYAAYRHRVAARCNGSTALKPHVSERRAVALYLTFHKLLLKQRIRKFICLQ